MPANSMPMWGIRHAVVGEQRGEAVVAARVIPASVTSLGSASIWARSPIAGGRSRVPSLARRCGAGAAGGRRM